METCDVTIHLSNDFRRTAMFADGDGFEKAAAEGCYDGDGFSFTVSATSHEEAAEKAYVVCNSDPVEMHCGEDYRDAVRTYRSQGHRSLSVGDLVMVRNRLRPQSADGRYGVAGFGFERF